MSQQQQQHQQQHQHQAPSQSAVPASIDSKISKWFHLDDDALRQIKKHVQGELELGLRDEEAATIKMLITYVRELSRGDEIGSYLALDLGGTNFRVLLVTLNGDGSQPKVTSVTHVIPQQMLVTQNGQELFDYIALKLLDFVKQYKLKRRRISLGFTFSFPCKQYGLTQSVLVKWCKGFNVGGVVGTDVVKQLKNALKRQLAGRVEAYIDVVAVINDTTGTLVACANKNRDCRIGLIVGTGFNACYMERLDGCEKWPANYTSPKQVIINCEWGAMGDQRERRELDAFRNEFDARIDQDSMNPLNQTYEKMVAGMYVGELLRLSMLSLYNAKLLFACDNEQLANSEQKATKSSTGSSKSTSSARCVVFSARSPSLAAASPSSSSSGGGGGAGAGGPASQMGAPVAAIQSSLRSRSTSSKGSRGGVIKSSNKSQKTAPDQKPRLDIGTGSSSSSGAPSNTNGGQQHNSRHKLNVKDVMNGKHLSMLGKDELAGNFEETIKILREINIDEYSQQDLAVVVRLGSAIMHRGAHLVACGISALLERVQHPNTVIGYDGSLVKHHPYFLKRMVAKCAQLTPAGLAFEFVQSSDGSGIGAAVVAAALHKERRPLYIVKPGKLYEMHCLRSQAQQSIISLEQGIAASQPHLPGMERVCSASSSRASSVSTALTGSATPPRSPSASLGAQSNGRQANCGKR